MIKIWNFLAAMLLVVASITFADEPTCKGGELAQAKSAAKEAKAAIDKSIAAIDSADKKAVQRLTTWFGAKSSSEMQQVRQILVSSRVYIDGAVFLCAVKTDIKIGDVYAYVRPDKAFVITLGAFFFNAPVDGYNSKSGIITHEMTHFVIAGATKDKAYGVEGAKALAISDPVAARKNADNFEYFTESIYFDLQ